MASATNLSASTLENMGSSIQKYPNPFFDLSKNYVPSNIKELFKFCRDYFHTTSFLRNAISKLTEYPITDLIYDVEIDQLAKDKYDTLLNDNLKIKSFLISVGRDYYTYGNSFISTLMVPKRFLICTACKETHLFDSVKFKLKNYEFFGKCLSCGADNIRFNIKDSVIKSIKNFRLIRFAPENIDVDWNPITNSATYYYNIPNKTKQAIVTGNRTVLKDIPEVFLESLKKKKAIELDNSNLFHLKYPTLAEEDMGWGKPIILPALKEIYYLQVLKRGNEAIANEHIVPKKAVSPANTTSMDPYSQMNLGKWRDQIQEQLKKWKRDPNYIGVFPIPIQYQELGGNAKMLMLTPELKFIEESIINSLGLPIDFVKGSGGSWTGSSVSLRIIENHFLSYRELLKDLLNYFLLPKISGLLDLPRIKMNFVKFKMSDDAQTKQLYVNMHAAGAIGEEKLLTEFGIDYEEERKSKAKTERYEAERSIERAKKAAQAQGEASVELAKYEVRAQQAARDELFKLQLESFEKELIEENVTIPEDPYQLIDRYVLELSVMSEQERLNYLDKMGKTKPITHSLILSRLQNFTYDVNTLAIPVLQTPPNEKGLGNREGDKIKIPETEKQKGNTRGTPQA